MPLDRRTLHDSTKMLAKAFDRAPLYLAISSVATGKFVDVNDTFVATTGYAREEAVGKSSAELGLWADPGEQSAGREQLMKHGFISEQEVRFRLKGGELRTFLISAEVVKLAGEPHILNAAVDITERKLAAAEQARLLAEVTTLNETLEQRVLERTREVRSLASQLTLAEAQERARLAQLLHDDLQQQLFTVQFALRDVHTAAGDNAEILAQLEQVNQLVKQAITTARSTTTNLSPPVLRGEGLAEALTWLSSYMNERYNLAVTVNAPTKLDIPNQSVRVLLFSLLRELLFNVIKHAGVNEATVDLRQSSAQLELSVSDLGTGFDPVRLEQDHSGTGLGLTGMRKRLELFGGDLRVVSAAGEGTRVTIVMPIHSPTVS